MKFIHKIVAIVIFTIVSMISVWFLLANMQPIQPALYAFIVCMILGTYFVVKILNSSLILTVKTYVLNLTKRKYFVVTALLGITLVGLLARLFFYYRFSYIPVSDPQTFFDSAKTLAAGGDQLGNTYVAFQPYLSAYNNLLGVAMRVISDPWLASILLNTLLDILSSVGIYLLLKIMLRPRSPLPVVAFGVWMLNPLNIIFSVLSLPVIIVNFFVILTILISYILMQQVIKLNAKNALLLSVLLGLTLGIGNCFRPIFIVAIVGLAIVFILMFLTTNKSKQFLKLSVLCIVILALLFAVIQQINVAVVSSQTGLHAAKEPFGWSMYVGSSMESSGEWRQYNNDEMSKICKNSLAQGDYDMCHTELRTIAIARYKDYGVFGSSRLFIKKLYHQAGQQNYFYNAERSIVGYSTSKTQKIINVYMIVYMLTLFLLTAKFLYVLAKMSASSKVINPILLFTALVMIGWFLSFMLAESAPRYSTILYPIFIIFSVLMLDNKYRGTSDTR